ncbi:NAD(P)H-dependent oxidoreductase [Streptomyces fodineus]|uniref:NAD(P)H-dependent oxidoreductase n=1 Tax=Streptomyces fodineus TaxID=1904616 RepID=UPI0009A121AF|nr:NAD(P)H-dependent oxidoreductase [Streptomyces fodineus]
MAGGSQESNVAEVAARLSKCPFQSAISSVKVSSRLRILGVSGSLRKESLNSRLLAALRPLAPKDVQIDVFDGLGDLPLYNQDLDVRDGVPEPVRRWRTAISEADGLLLVSPEYNGSIPGVVKNAIDWASRPVVKSALAGKCVVTMAATPGRGLGRGGLADLGRVLHDCHAHVISGPWVVLTEAGDKLSDAEDEKSGTVVPTILDPVTRAIASAQLVALTEAIKGGAGEHAAAPLRAYFAAVRPQS